MLVNIVGWIIFGALAGWVANRLMKGYSQGLVMNVILGIIGAVVGGWLFQSLGIRLAGGPLASFVTAVVGAMAVIFVAGLINRRR